MYSIYQFWHEANIQGKLLCTCFQFTGQVFSAKTSSALFTYAWDITFTVHESVILFANTKILKVFFISSPIVLYFSAAYKEHRVNPQVAY
jgi:hypothetical protein